MGSDIMLFACAITGAGNDFAIADNDSADRHFTALGGPGRLLKRQIHDAPVHANLLCCSCRWRNGRLAKLI